MTRPASSDHRIISWLRRLLAERLRYWAHLVDPHWVYREAVKITQESR